MMKTLHHIIRGFGYLPSCGHHPGLGVLAVFVLMGGVAATPHGGWRGFLVGGSAMAVVFGPLAAYGAYERSVLDERLTNEELAQQRKQTP